MTKGRTAALAVIGVLAAGLAYPALPDGPGLSVPAGARAGDLTTRPCTYQGLAADCGTLVVPENRHAPGSALIALPVTRVRATGPGAAEPIFRLEGGPGATNMAFPEAGRLAARHDVVLVGYRGVDGSRVLACPEVEHTLRRSADLAGEASQRRYADAFADCARRLSADGVDLAGYSLPQRVDDLEAARRGLGYGRINLVSESAGTRTAMIYAWRYPESLHRSVMIAVNPPGHYLWDPRITDEQLAHYGRLCAADARCAARTGDLAGSLRATAADAPDRWLFLPIKDGNVRAATLWGLFDTTDAAAPLNAPAMFDAWLRAEDGDASGLWAVSTLAALVFPGSFVWGEFAATGAIDAPAVEAYYAAGGDPGSILGNAATDFVWGGGRLTTAWPASPDSAQYRTVRPSPVETLLVGGTVDFSTPPRIAAEELLPALPNGHQVVLAELGHTTDFWHHRPDAAQHLLTSFFDRGEVDASRYETRPASFEVTGPSMSAIAWTLLGTLTGAALLAGMLLAWMARRVRRHGRFGPRAGAWLRTLAPVPLGIGGWFAAVLAAAALWPSAFPGDWLILVPSMGVAVGLGVHLARVHRDSPRATRLRDLAVTVAGALSGAWLGLHAGEGPAAALTALLGAALAANLAAVVLDILRDRRARPV